jgi:glycosyltransferase involved in cell wall biosynthesis
MLSIITPVVLTFNEERNIRRTLDALPWAKDVVVLDSFSTDRTKEIALIYPQVRFFQRVFDNHCAQWNFAIKETGILTEWVLALDADHIVGPGLQKEIAALTPSEGVNGYSIRFKYAVFGKVLPSSSYPPSIALFRKEHARYYQDGHTQKLELTGAAGRLNAFLVHDDRKTTDCWIKSQLNYALLEYEKLKTTPRAKLSLPDRVRMLKIAAPLVMLLFCLLVKRNIFRGKAGFFYAFQRMTAELLLSLLLMESDLNGNPGEK